LQRLLSVEGRLQTGAVSVGLLEIKLNDAHLVNLIELSNTICRCEDLRHRVYGLRAIFHLVYSETFEQRVSSLLALPLEAVALAASAKY
jgi:hypothetical protein